MIGPAPDIESVGFVGRVLDSARVDTGVGCGIGDGF